MPDPLYISLDIDQQEMDISESVPQYTKDAHEPPPPSYQRTELPNYSRRSSSSSRSLQESEISHQHYKKRSECSEFCSDCVVCFHCCSGQPNNTSTDKRTFEVLMVILTCGICMGGVNEATYS